MSKRLSKAGKSTSAKAEIQNISLHGIWILVNDEEFFMPFTEFPWFLKATIEQIYTVEFFHGHHLHWPILDIDIDTDMLRNPDKYPLKYSTGL
jgi:hypothetical protein